MNSQIKVLQVIEPHKILNKVFRLDNSTMIIEIAQEKNRKKFLFLFVFNLINFLQPYQQQTIDRMIYFC